MKNQVTITHAAELAGVTRQTVSRKISDGVLSKNSDGKIDISELLRVYPNIKITDEPSNATPSYFNVELQLKLQLLEQENQHMKQRIDDLQSQLDEARKDKAELMAIFKRQTSSLPDYSKQSTASWWGFLTERSKK